MCRLSIVHPNALSTLHTVCIADHLGGDMATKCGIVVGLWNVDGHDYTLRQHTDLIDPVLKCTTNASSDFMNVVRHRWFIAASGVSGTTFSFAKHYLCQLRESCSTACQDPSCQVSSS